MSRPSWEQYEIPCRGGDNQRWATIRMKKSPSWQVVVAVVAAEQLRSSSFVAGFVADWERLLHLVSFSKVFTTYSRWWGGAVCCWKNVCWWFPFFVPYIFAVFCCGWLWLWQTLMAHDWLAVVGRRFCSVRVISNDSFLFVKAGGRAKGTKSIWWDKWELFSLTTWPSCRILHILIYCSDISVENILHCTGKKVDTICVNKFSASFWSLHFFAHNLKRDKREKDL